MKVKKLLLDLPNNANETVPFIIIVKQASRLNWKFFNHLENPIYPFQTNNQFTHNYICSKIAKHF